MLRALTSLAFGRAARRAYRKPAWVGRPRPPSLRRRIGVRRRGRSGVQRATMPSPPTALATVTDPIFVSAPLALTANSSTVPFALVWV
jgi:hypothetical protein